MPDFKSAKASLQKGGEKVSSRVSDSRVRHPTKFLKKDNGPEFLERAYNHQSTPLQSLKDPDLFGPPPKTNTSALTRSSEPGSLKRTDSNDSSSSRNTKDSLSSRPVPSVPFRKDTTGLSTSNLPKPPVRSRTIPVGSDDVSIADGGDVIGQSSATAAVQLAMKSSLPPPPPPPASLPSRPGANVASAAPVRIGTQPTTDQVQPSLPPRLPQRSKTLNDQAGQRQPEDRPEVPAPPPYAATDPLAQLSPPGFLSRQRQLQGQRQSLDQPSQSQIQGQGQGQGQVQGQSNTPDPQTQINELQSRFKNLKGTNTLTPNFTSSTATATAASLRQDTPSPPLPVRARTLPAPPAQLSSSSGLLPGLPSGLSSRESKFKFNSSDSSLTQSAVLARNQPSAPGALGGIVSAGVVSAASLAAGKKPPPPLPSAKRRDLAGAAGDGRNQSLPGLGTPPAAAAAASTPPPPVPRGSKPRAS